MNVKPSLADWWNSTDKRFKWAYAAVSPFEKQLSTYQNNGVKFDHQLNNLVCVYGRSQVGKTTLILELMGVDDSQHIADVFRGGAEIGEFATSVPTYYRASHDENWRLEYNGEVSLYADDKDVKSYLAQLRIDIQSGKSISYKCLTIDIPDRAFVTNYVHLNVLDLPGVYGAGGTKEQVSSRDFAETHLRHASMILMVTRADDLTSIFDPETHEITTLRAWPEFRHRFKFVLTYAMSSDNFQKKMTSKLSDGENWTIELFRNHFRTELDHELFSRLGIDIEKFLPNLYPLELGKSWRGMSKYQKELFSGVRKDLLAELKDKINQADRPVSRFTNLYQYSTILENFKRRKSMESERDGCLLVEERKPLLENLKIEEDIISTYTTWISSFEQVTEDIRSTVKEEVNRPCKFVNISDVAGGLYSIQGGITVDKKQGIETLQNLLSTMQRRIDREVNEDFCSVLGSINNKMIESCSDTPFGDKLDFVNSVFGEIKRCLKIDERIDAILSAANSLERELGKRLMKSYFRNGTKWKDEKHVLDVITGAMEPCSELRNFYVRTINDSYTSVINKVMMIVSEAMQLVTRRHNSIAEQVKSVSAKLIANQQQQKVIIDQVDVDIRMAKGIFKSIEKSYHETRSWHWNNSMSMTPELAYIELLKILQIDRDFQAIKKENFN